MSYCNFFIRLATSVGYGKQIQEICKQIGNGALDGGDHTSCRQVHSLPSSIMVLNLLAEPVLESGTEGEGGQDIS